MLNKLYYPSVKKALALSAIVTLGLSLSAHADTAAPTDDTQNQSHWGIAMHGTPKYTEESVKLEYTNANAPKGGKIKYSATGTFDTLNPYSIKGKAAKGLNLVYDRLMGRVWDEPFSMYPLIAQSYKTDDARSYIRFTLNPSATFSDGTQITNEDVIFSFETLKESGRPNMRRVYTLVNNIERGDDGSITFHFTEGYDRETALIIAMMPVLSKAYWKEREFDSTTLDIPLTNGPYVIESLDPGRRITYKRNPDYWGKDLLVNKGHYNFDTVIYDYYRDDTVAFQAFKAGEIDLRREYDAGKWESAYNGALVENGTIIQDEIAHQRPERASGFIFNTRRAPFDDIKTREALELLMDHDWINTNIFHGQYKQIRSYFPNSEFQAVQDPAPPGFDLRSNMRQARDILRDAGWSVVDGVLTKNGQPFQFELLTNTPEDEKIALNFKKNLERLGIDMTIRVMDDAAFRGRLNNYDYDMVSYYWQSSLSPGTEQILYWGCQAAKEPARWNFPGICDDDIEALAKAVAHTKERSALVRTMRSLDQKLIDGHYMIPLFYRGSDYIAHQSSIKRPTETPIYGAVLETWWSEKPKETQ